MNRIYRLVFNRALGVWQVTSELVRSAVGTRVDGGGRQAAALRSVSFAVWLALGYVGMSVPGAAQQAPLPVERILADPNAPGNQRPTVVAAPNGTPLVNITTPSNAGVSRNAYTQFDVGSRGAIVNNSRTEVQTQLGGWVQGNPWLATGTARVILNEVNSANPSYLKGYLEVAGDRAELVIANPAGIQIDGGGFINASRTTLTTGKPVFNGGSLDHYRVEGGVIGVSGAGLDASRTGYTDLIARSLQVNAGIWAQNLSVTAGVNTVAALNGATQVGAAGTPAPGLAIDVGRLGGMYAGKIALIGTEQGVGVRNAGAIGAQAGDLVVTVDGRLENTGSLQSQQDTRVSAGAGIANAGMLSAARELTVGTRADVDNRGGTLNAMHVEVNAQSLRNRDGAIEQTGMQALALNAGALSNRDGGRIGDAGSGPGEGPAAPGSGSEPGSGGNGDPGQSGEGGTGNGGDPGAPPVVPLGDGALNIAGLLDNDGGRIQGGGGIALMTDDGLDNAGGQLGLRKLTITRGDLINQSGKLTVAGAAHLDVGLFDNDEGTFQVNALSLQADSLSNRQGSIQHSGTDATWIDIAGTLDNTAGSLASNASKLGITASRLINEGGRVQQAGTQGLEIATGRLDGSRGTLATAGTLVLAAAEIDHRNATLSAEQVKIDAARLDNRDGTVLATGGGANRVAVSGTLDNTRGTLAGNGDLSLVAATLVNTRGVVQQAGEGSLDIDAGALDGEGGTLASNGSLSITGQSTDLRDGITSARRIIIDTGDLTTAGGQLTATGDETLRLRVRNTLDNGGGTLGSNGALVVSAETFHNQQGHLIAAGTAASTMQVGGAFDNRGGQISTRGDIALRAGDLDNTGGTVLAADGARLRITAEGRLDNGDGGRIAAGGDLALSAATLDNRGGSLEHAGEGELSVRADALRGDGGVINSGGALQLAGADIELRGASTSARRIEVAAGTLTTAGGTLASTGADALTLSVQGALDNTKGTIAANGALELEAGSLSNREGMLTSAGTGSTRIRVAGTLDNTEGTLASNADALNIEAADLVNQDGHIQQAGTQRLDIVADRLDGNRGTIVTAGVLHLAVADITHRDAMLSAGQVNIDASSLDNSGGTILATGGGANRLTVSDTLDNTRGTLAGNGDVSLAANMLVNRQGIVQQAGDGGLDIDAGILDGEGGTLASNGSLSIAGQSIELRDGITSARRIAIDAGDLITAGGRLTATGDEALRLQVRNTLDNSGGTLGSNGAIHLNANALNNAQGLVQAAGPQRSVLDVAAGLDNHAGRLVTAGDAWIRAGSLSNRGGIVNAAATSQLQVDVEGLLDNREYGMIAGGGDLRITAQVLDNREGTLGAGGALEGVIDTGIDNASGVMQAGQSLALTGNGLINADGTIIGAQVRIDTRGKALDNDGGTVASTAGDIELRSGSLHNTAGLVQSTGDLTLDTAGQAVINHDSGSTGGLLSAGRMDLLTGYFDNGTGVVFAQGDARLEASAIDNTTGGQLGSMKNLMVQGEHLSNSGGTVQAGGDAQLVLAGHLDNQGGLVAAANALAVSAATVDNRDTLSTSPAAPLGLQADMLWIDAGTLDNRRGQLLSDTRTDLLLTGLLDNATGQVSSGGELRLQADAVSNTGGTLLSGGDQTLNARRLSGDGRVLSKGDAMLTLQEDFSNTGEVTANGTLFLATTGDLHNAGLIQAGRIELRADDIENAAGGEIAGVGQAHLVAQGTLTNRGLVDGAIADVKAGILDNLGTGRIYGDHLAIEAGEIRNRAETVDGVIRSATLAARERLDLGVATLTNTGGSLIYSDGDAAIGGALDADRRAVNAAGRIDNLGSIIEVAGDLEIQSQAVSNIRENVIITQTTTVKDPVRLDQPDWRHNGSNNTSNIRGTSNYGAYEVYYLHPDDVLEDTPYITPDGYAIRRAVVRLTPQTSAYFFGRGALYEASGERSRLNVEDGTITLYYFGRQDNQVNPDQATTGADDPFAELSAIQPGSPAFHYVSDTLTYDSSYGTCTTNCVQLWAQHDYDDPERTLINPQRGANLGQNEQYRIAMQTVTEDVLAPGAGTDAVIHAGGAMRIGTDELVNRHGRVAAGGDLSIEGLTAAARVTNVGQTLYRTYDFDNVTHAYNGSIRAWSNPSISEQIGQVGGAITSGGALTVDVGDLSNLNQGRDAPNVQDGAAMANLHLQGPGSGPTGPGGPAIDGPGTVTGQIVGTAAGAGPQVVAGGNGPANGTVEGTGPVRGGTVIQAADGSPDTIAAAILDTQLPAGSLFTVQPDGGGYLVETDPRFADYRSWLGSDYLLDTLGYDSAQLHKRLGDGYYEQKLVREQIGQLTGRRFLSGHGNDEEQFRALMEAGATFAGQYGLRPGVALSAEQMAQLTSDIVWLVEQTVTLPDGTTTTALVPQVYLRLHPGDMSENGALLAGADVKLNLRGDLVNTGDIAGRRLVSIDAANIHNLAGGAISGRAVGLQAAQDINVIGATVTATDVLKVQAGGDVTVASTTQIREGAGYRNASLDRVAGLYVTHPDGLGALTVDAGGDITLQAAKIQNSGTNGLTQIAAAGNINLATLTTHRSTDATYDGRNHYRTDQTMHVGTTVQGAGHVVVQAGQDVDLTAAQLSAGKALAVQAGGNINSLAVVDSVAQDMAQAGRKSSIAVSTSNETVRGSTFTAGSDIALQAGNDITLQAATASSETGGIALAAGRDVNLTSADETHVAQVDEKGKKSGLLSSKTTTTHDRVEDTYAIGTVLSGETVQIAAGRDIATQAAQVVGTGDVLLAAGRDIDIGTGENTHAEEHDKSVKKSGLFSGGGVGFTIGQQKRDTTADITETTHVGSAIGSLEGRVDMVAGGDVTVTGSEVISQAGIGILGQNVTIQAAEDITDVTETQKFKQSGINVSLKGGAVDTAMAVRSSVDRAGEVKDDRLAALHLAKAGQTLFSGNQAGMNSLAGAGDQLEALANTNKGTPASGNSGLSLRVGIGASSSSSTMDYNAATASGSRIASAGDVVIQATGDGQGNGGDLTVTGSRIEGDNVTLAAARDLLLQSQQETQEQVERNKASSGEIGFTFGSEAGIGVYVSASAAKGKGQGLGTTHAETTVEAADTLTLISGRDTTLEGAQARGETVIANIGRDLTLTSQQDTNDYRRKDQSAGIDVAVGTGGASVSGYYNQSKIDSSYTSVKEQTGIQAGQGGFDIQVGEHTQLTGAAIASTATADKNRLSTGSLSAADLRNEAEYTAKSFGISGGGGSSGGSGFSGGVSPSLPMSQSDSASSTTRSDISAGTLEVRNGDASAVANLDRKVTELQQDGLKAIFDEQKVQERMELGQLAGEVGMRAAGDLSQRMEWKEGSKEKVLLHGAVGAAIAALGGGNALEGMTGAAASQLATVAMQNYLRENNIDPTSPEGSTLMELGSLAVGAALGGGSGAATALYGEQFNRQLHPDEEKIIAQLVTEGYTEEEVRAVACAMVQCLLGRGLMEPGSMAEGLAGNFYLTNAGEQLANEYQMVFSGMSQDEVSAISKRLANTGMFQYSAGDVLYDAVRDTGFMTRLDGLGQATTGTLGALGVSAFCTLTGGLGCVAGGTTAAAEASDNITAGLAAFYTGRPTLTLQNQVWQGLGLSPEQANLAEGMTGLVIAGSGAYATNRALSGDVTTLDTVTVNPSGTNVNHGNSSLGTVDNLLPEANFIGQIPTRADLQSHLTNARVSGKQISGGHNMYNFESTLQEAGGKVVSKVEVAPGVYEIEYKIQSGMESKPRIKTVYDSTIYSDSQMSEMASVAAVKAQVQFQVTGNPEQYVKIGDIWFYAPINIDKTTGGVNGIRTVYPSSPPGGGL